MKEPDNYEFFIFALIIAGVGLSIYFLVRLLDPWMKKWIDSTSKKREALEVKYRALSNDDIVQFLQNLDNNCLLEMMAALNIAETRIQDEKIRIIIHDLQESNVYAIKERAKDIIKKWKTKE